MYASLWEYHSCNIKNYGRFFVLVRCFTCLSVGLVLSFCCIGAFSGCGVSLCAAKCLYCSFLVSGDMKRWLFFLCCLPVLLWPVTVVAGALPELRLSFRGGTGALQREVWTQPAALSVVMPDGREVYRSRRAAVKLHGHSTAAKAKKPVALRLASPAPLLGMAHGRRWVLLANVMDHSYMRNRLAFAMARLTSLPWTPDSRFVNVVVNGRPQGCYLLVEAVRVGPQRVDVGGRGGFLVELDAYRDAPAVFLTPRRRLPVGVKWPADPSPRRLRQIRSFFDCVEELLYGAPADTGRLWSECLDRLSFTDW